MVCSLLKTTENTRDLGGYITKTGKKTRCESILRSDVQNYPSEEDIEFLRLFRAEYGDTNTYFGVIGLDDEEIKALRDKL